MSNSNYNDKNTARWIVIFFVAIYCAVFILLNGIGVAFAAETGNIMQDLSTLTVDGKAFNVDDYPADETGKPQILAAYELGYSFYTNNQDDFGLLLYVYNPSQISVTDDKRNAVQLKVGSAERYDKYALKLIELSADKLFCKFKVNFTDEEKETVLSFLDRDGRRYEISTIEIYESGTNATSYPIERAYVFTGYGKGYGQTDSESTLSGTLNYTEEGGTETVPLEVHHTTWRPEGSVQSPDFGTNDDYGTGGSGGSGSGGGGGFGSGDSDISSKYLQDSIHSVYFAVPNELAAQYDYLNSVKCEWYEALTAPILVTGNAEIYNAVQNLIEYQALINSDPYCEAPEEFDFSNFNYAIGGGIEKHELGVSRNYNYFCELTLNRLFSYTSNAVMLPKNELKTIFWNIYAGEIDVGNYSVTSEEIANYAKTVRPFLNDNKVAGKYPSYLFENWDTEKHVEVIPVGKTYTLTSKKIVQSFWEKIFGTSHVENKEEYKPNAIQEVKSLTGDKAKDCANYYVSERDYSEFSAFYQANKDNATIYMLRFAASKYVQMQAETVGETKKLGITCREVIDTNSYFAQTKTYLDFDIIDLEYVKDDKSYVLPVNMSPIDIFPEITPPVYWDGPINDFWKYGCGIIAGLIAVYAVYKVAFNIIRG